jgi:hypothetical protein
LLGRFPITRDGHRWIIVCTDYLTRFAVTKALAKAEATEVAKFMVEEIILKHGAPTVMISDRGRSFLANIVKDINQLCQTSHRLTTASLITLKLMASQKDSTIKTIGFSRCLDP